MKKRKKRNPKKETEGVDLPFFTGKESGKFQKNSTVVYSLALPFLSAKEYDETKDLLLKIKEAFLSFLKKESEKTRSETYLGALSFQAKKNRVTLFSSYSPFEEKEEKKVADFIFSEKGKLLKIE